MFLVIMKTNEDFAISHLKINITDQKYWLKYVEKYSAMNLDASSPQRGKLILILKSLSDKGLKLKRIAHKEIFLCNVYDIYGQATKQKPLFEPTLKMTFSHCHWPARGVKWQLSLLTLLWLNLSFPNFRLRDIAGSIEGNNIAVHSRDAGELFTFGGTQSMFCVYLRGRLIHIVYMITHYKGTSVTCDITMISQRLIFHSGNAALHINILSSAYQHIHVKKLTIFMDKIVVEKFQIIYVNFQKQDDSVLCFVLFDGPWVSKKCHW